MYIKKSNSTSRLVKKSHGNPHSWFQLHQTTHQILQPCPLVFTSLFLRKLILLYLDFLLQMFSYIFFTIEDKDLFLIPLPCLPPLLLHPNVLLMCQQDVSILHYSDYKNMTHSWTISWIRLLFLHNFLLFLGLIRALFSFFLFSIYYLSLI